MYFAGQITLQAGLDIFSIIKHFTWIIKFFIFIQTIQITGELEVGYVSSETPMVVYLNVHTAIEQLRQKVEREGKNAIGPRVSRSLKLLKTP